MFKIFWNSSALFTTPSFLKGTCRVVDLFGYLDDYNYKETEAEADTEALRRDWGIIGLDIQKGISLYGQQRGDSADSAVITTTK